MDAIFLVVSAFICSKRDSRLVHCNKKSNSPPNNKFPHLGVPELDLGHRTRIVPFVQLLSRILAEHLIRLNEKVKGEKSKPAKPGRTTSE